MGRISPSPLKKGGMVRHSTDNISDIAPFLVYNQHNGTLQSSSYPPTASITEPHSQNKEAETVKSSTV